MFTVKNKFTKIILGREMCVLLEGNFFVIRIVYDHTNACYGPLNGMANSDSSHPVIMYIKCSISNGSLFLSKIGMVIVYIYLMLPSCLKRYIVGGVEFVTVL